MAYMNPLMAALGSSIKQPDEPPPKMGKGQLIMGIIADALAGAAGREGPFATMMAKRNLQQDEEVQWQRHRKDNLADYGEQQRLQQLYAKPPTPSEFEQVLAASGVHPGTPEWTQAMSRRAEGMLRGADPPVFVTLPNKQVYAGPQSGLSQALMGGGQAPQRPVGMLTPINGGQTPPASGGFPR